MGVSAWGRRRFGRGPGRLPGLRAPHSRGGHRSSVPEQGALVVEARHQLRHGHVERVGQLNQRREARISSRALELAHVVAREPCSGGERLLAEIVLAANAAEDSSEDDFRAGLHRTEIFTVRVGGSHKSEMEVLHMETEN